MSGPPTNPSDPRLHRAAELMVRGHEWLGAGKHDAALEIFAKALELYRQAGHLPGQARAHLDAASAQLAGGSSDRALEELQSAVRIFERLGDQGGQAVTLFAIGSLHHSHSRHQQALDNLTRSLAIRERMGEGPRDVALMTVMTLNAIGVVEVALARYRDALHHFEGALGISERIGELTGQADALHQIGLIHARQSRDRRAREHFDREAWVLHQIGTACLAESRHKEAVEHFERALTICERIESQAGKAAMLHQIGMIHLAESRHQEALERFERSLQISEQLENERAQAATLFAIAAGHLELSRYDLALEHLQRALELHERFDDPAGRLAVLQRLAEIHVQQSRDERALEHFECALELNERIGDKAGQAATLHQIGTIHMRRSRYEDALEHSEHALTIWGDLNRAPEQVDTLLQVGTIHMCRSNYEPALEQFERVVEIAGRLGDKAGEGTALHQIATIHIQQSRYRSALEHAERALAIYRGLDDPGRQAAALDLVGSIRLRQSRYDQALDCFERALALSEQVDDKPGQAARLRQIGSIRLRQSRYEEALEFSERALIVAERVSDEAGQAVALHQIGTVHLGQSRQDQALDYSERALEIAECLGKESGQAADLLPAVLLQIASLYYTLSRDGPALEYAERALEIAEGIGNESRLAGSLHLIGSIQLHHSRYDEAHQSLARALKIEERLGDGTHEAATLHGIGNIHLEQGRHDLALDHFERALAIDERIGFQAGQASALHQIGMIHANESRVQQALDYFARAFEVNERIGDPARAGATLAAAAGLHALIGDDRRLEAQGRMAHRDNARELYREAVRRVESTRSGLGGEGSRVSFFASKAELYRDFAGFLARSAAQSEEPDEWAAEAFQVAQRGKARAFLDALKRGDSELTGAVDPGFRQRWLGVHGGLAEVDARLRAVAAGIRRLEVHRTPEGAPEWLAADEAEALLPVWRAERDRLLRRGTRVEDELRRLQAELWGGGTDARALSVREVQERLVSQDGALLEYLVGEEASLLFCVTREEVGVFELPPVGALESMVRELRVATYAADAQGQPLLDAYPHGHALYLALIGGAAEMLRGKREFLICPDGALHYLPFALVLTQDPDGGNRQPPKGADGQSPPDRQDEESSPAQDSGRDLVGIPAYEDFAMVGPSVPTKSSRSNLDPAGTESADLERARQAVAGRDWSGRWAELPYLLNGLPGSDEPVTLRFAPSAQIAAHFRDRARRSKAQRIDGGRELLACAYPAQGLADGKRGVAAWPTFEAAGRKGFDEIPETIPEVWEAASALAPSARLPVEANRPDRYTHPEPPLELLTNLQATKSNLTRAAQKPSRIVHIAAHATPNNTHPALSHILLSAGSEGEAEPWRAYEIAAARIDCQLAILSCCETALGQNVTGEGIVSLTRAFQQAGAQAVYATLWRIPDQHTRILMRDLYSHLAQHPEQHAAHALAKTQHHHATCGAHPASWAAFTTWG